MVGSMFFMILEKHFDRLFSCALNFGMGCIMQINVKKDDGFQTKTSLKSKCIKNIEGFRGSTYVMNMYVTHVI
jgi:hypothetical protein